MVLPSNALYLESLEVTLPVTILYGTEPSPTAGLSSIPVTTTVCITFQLLEVNTTLLAAIVPSPVLSILKLIVTSEVGSAFNTIVNEPVPPSSVVMLSTTCRVAPIFNIVFCVGDDSFPQHL